MYRNTSRMNLCKTRVSKKCPLLITLPCRRTVTVHSVCREEIYVAVSATRNNYCMSSKSFNLTGDNISCNNTFCFSFNQNKVKHLITRIAFNRTLCNLSVHSSISSNQQLLSGLSAGIKCTANLCASERTIIEQSAVISCEWNSLSNTLIYNIITYLSKTVNICLPASVITTFYGIIKQSVYRVIIILIIFSSINTSLICNRVSSSWRIADTKYLDIIPSSSQRSCS